MVTLVANLSIWLAADASYLYLEYLSWFHNLSQKVLVMSHMTTMRVRKRFLDKTGVASSDSNGGIKYKIIVLF